MDEHAIAHAPETSETAERGIRQAIRDGTTNNPLTRRNQEGRREYTSRYPAWEGTAGPGPRPSARRMGLDRVCHRRPTQSQNTAQGGAASAGYPTQRGDPKPSPSSVAELGAGSKGKRLLKSAAPAGSDGAPHEANVHICDASLAMEGGSLTVSQEQPSYRREGNTSSSLTPRTRRLWEVQPWSPRSLRQSVRGASNVRKGSLGNRNIENPMRVDTFNLKAYRDGFDKPLGERTFSALGARAGWR